MAELHPDWLQPDWPAPAGVEAVMTTRAGGASTGPFASMNLRAEVGDDPAAVAQNLARLGAATGARPVWLQQVHGARVVRLGLADLRDGVVHEADASITTEPGIACAVQVADCLPVLLAAPGGVGAAHAGWRGLARGVVEATLEALCEAAGCAPGDAHAWLGACIGPDRFEVGDDVREAFGAGRDAAVQARFRPGVATGKWWADLAGLARDRLHAAGVASIAGGGWCTVSDASRFFSFRRDRVTGRMGALVWRRG